MIRNITVYLDDAGNESENVIRCGFIVTENDNGEETCHNDLIDQSEYSSLNDLVLDIAGIFKVNRRDILVNA
ncbi:MAG: hypothetical protein KKG47_03120 [Proteobacteria bacterium]|nr:hypothetical protein [Pseudomonadota bacterium]MBU1738885.1 hypothetical protein [Pseudomonadota bacterium]